MTVPPGAQPSSNPCGSLTYKAKQLAPRAALSRAMHPWHQGVPAPDQCRSLQVQVEQEVGQSAMPLLVPTAMQWLAVVAPEQACASCIRVVGALGAVLEGEAFILFLLPGWAQAEQAVACILQILGDGLKAAPRPGQLCKEVAGAAQVAAALRLSQGLEHGTVLPFCTAQAAAGAEVGLREAVRRWCLLGQAVHSAVRQKHPSALAASAQHQALSRDSTPA